MPTRRVLFLRTGNSCRSQMAEGWLRHLGGDRFEALSAGTEPQGLNPFAVQVMAEAGVDIAAPRSKSVEGFLGQEVDPLVTVCSGGRSWSLPGPRDIGPCAGGAQESCPAFPGRVGGRLQWAIDDPAIVTGTDDEVLPVFRRVRDELRARVEGLLREGE
ncbi:MAG: arsenate reductase ArsC [Deltaproteobacteria bacterium]|nr:arsenate reductase ArsC [Deltaproteobacteria bacterium]